MFEEYAFAYVRKQKQNFTINHNRNEYWAFYDELYGEKPINLAKNHPFEIREDLTKEI